MPVQDSNLAPVFYMVCYRPFDGNAQNNAILTGVRRDYLTTRKSSSGKYKKCLAGTNISISYKIAKGKFLWRKNSGKILLQESYPEVYGYCIWTRSLAGETISKARYAKDHSWLQTAYYQGDTKRPVAFLKPVQDSEELLLLELNAKTGKYEAVRLFPFENNEGTAQQSLINTLAGEPQVYAETDRGSFCYCTKEELKSRMSVMNDLNTGKESLIPQWPYVEEESITFSYIVNDGSAKPAQPESVPEPQAENPSEQTAQEADYAADHEIFSTDEPAKPARYTVAAKGLNGETQISDYLPLHLEKATKRIVISAEESYLYFGKVINGLRQGRGRTQMQNGYTAYEGDYVDDKRDGFGAYYYKSGKICYVGDWKANRRDGLGISYSSRDGTIFFGRWKDNIPTGNGAAFDAEGNLIYTGEWKNGMRHGHGTEYKNGEIVFTGEFREDKYYSGYKRIQK
ncbi:MAG: hypothetical protein GX485_02610 [Clostridiales bacterium]|jgi:hypothetical protein|nr:hypothetical protein [Clostridiales bacterium]